MNPMFEKESTLIAYIRMILMDISLDPFSHFVFPIFREP
jgi:hypothetical protein